MAPASVAGGSTTPQIKFDAAALSQADRIVGTATIVLFISLFLPWFSVSFGGFSVSADGLTGHGYLYIPLFISIAVIALLGAQALGVWKVPDSLGVSRDQLLLVATVVSLVIVVLGFLLKPGGSAVGWSWGAFVGLAAAVVAALPLGRPALQARRGR
jgi:peptidoglycan/LPS O-acetylase OafA/YrhL